MRGTEQIAVDVLVGRLRSELERELGRTDMHSDYGRGIRFALGLLPAQRNHVDEGVVNGVPLTVGGPVKIVPSQPRKRDGYLATVRALTEQDGQITEIEVVDPRNGSVRTYHPERVTRAPKKRGQKCQPTAT